MNFGLTDRVALVTAASRGFGRAVAETLAAEGAHIAMCARGEDALKEAAAAVDAAGPGRVLAQPTDVTDPQSMAQLVRETESRLGPISCCLVNVGGPPPGGLDDLRPAQFEAAYDLLIDSALRLTQLLLPGMTQRGWGRIVQITSVTVRQPIPNLTLSNVLRPAVHALTKVLALEAAPHGVTINSVAPGHHTTDRVDELMAAQAERDHCSVADIRAGHEAEIPMGRLGEPKELAALVAFLMSEQAAFITGQCIVADGGWVRGTF